MPAVLSDAHGPTGEPLLAEQTLNPPSRLLPTISAANQIQAAAQAARWAAEGTGWIHAYLLWDWADTYNRIAQVNNVELRYDPPDQTRNNARFYVVDLLSELECACAAFLAVLDSLFCSLHFEHFQRS